ncbi:MAG: hybrid sensor histidine kinase/response regulator [Bacteroidota bacterium]
MPLGNPIRILLIDDDEEDFIITSDLVEEIRHRKYLVDWTDDFQVAQERIENQSYDIYLVDYRLGHHSGLEIIEYAIKQGYTKPLILLTGQGDIEIDEAASKAGAADYLVKNTLSAEVLERAIRYSIRQAQNLERIRELNVALEERVVERTQALAKAVEELRHSQQLYRTIASNYPNGTISVIDRHLRYVFLEGRELNYLGWNRDDLIGKPMSTVIPEESLRRIMPMLQRIFEGEQLIFELDLQNSTYAVQGVPLENANGEFQQALIVANNVTERKKAELETQKALKRERELSEMKSRFVSMASHEFRTPLGTILSSISLIGRYNKPEHEPKKEKHIHRIKESVSNLTGILDDFLSLSKLEEGKISTDPSYFDIFPLLNEVAEDMEGMFKEGQKILTQRTGTNGQVFLDKRLTKNIAINLLSNAIKYSGENKRIFLRVNQSPSLVSIEVEDQGIGIPEEEQIHLFERFYRANNATNIQGTGLGLNIVQKYVNLMNGNIKFRSKLNEGTTFMVDLPLD